MKVYIIYRDAITKKILSYSVYKKQPEILDDMILKYNSDLQHGRVAEKVFDNDLIGLIEIAEEKVKLRLSDVKDIVDAFDNLQTEIYQLKDRFEV